MARTARSCRRLAVVGVARGVELSSLNHFVEVSLSHIQYNGVLSSIDREAMPLKSLLVLNFNTVRRRLSGFSA